MANQIIGLTNESAYAGDVIHLVKGMNKTYGARFVIERYQAGVDLNTLVWSVNMRAANNALYYDPVTVSEYDDNAIYIDWVITNAATLARGTTFYTVEGKTAGDDAPVWRSTIHSIDVSEAVDAGEIYEGADEDAVEQLILELRADMNTALGNTVHYNAADNKTDTEKTQARSNIGAVSSDDVVIEDTYNILPVEKNFTFTASKSISNLTIPAGTYTLSMKITSSDVDSDKCQVNFHAQGQTSAVTFHMFNRGSYEYWIVTLNQDCNEIKVFAGQGASGSTGDTATVENMMLVSGAVERLYTPNVSPVDYTARNTLEGMKHNDVKIAFFGDSIVWGAIKTPNSGNTSFVISQANPTIAGVIGSRLHCTVDNYGVSGAGYKVAPSGGMNIYDYIQTIDLSTYTHVMILAGDNDSSVGETGIGTYQDTTGDTVMGQIYLIMTYLHEEYPQIIPVICHKNNKIALKTSPTATPTEFGSFPDYYYGYTYGGTDGFSIAKLHEEIDKFCDYYHVCKIDYKDFCMGGWQLQEMVGPDMTHFSQYGYNVLGKYLAGQMQRLIG